MVTQDQGERLYQGVCNEVTHHLRNKVRPFIIEKVDDDFLLTLVKAWDDHKKSMKLIEDVLMYMHQIFVVKRQCDSVKKLGLLLFLDEVVRYADVRERLRDCMIGMIKREREGKSVDRHSFGKTCEMLLVLGLESRSVYEEDFEKVFLLESAKFYALRGQEYMKTKTVFGYLTIVEQHIAEEAERAKHYLDESTVVSVIEVVRNELFGNLLKAIEDMNDMDVDHMVKSRMDTENLTVTKHVRCLATPALKNDEDSVSIIPKVTDLKELFDHFPLQFYKNEHLAKQTKATDVAYILSWPSLASKLPMHLWVFLDDIIQQGVKNMTKQEIDELLDKIIERFCCVQEKDRFKQNLEKQFLFNKTTADEQEMNMVATGKSGHLPPSRIEEMGSQPA
ncbi:cullin-3 [Rhipicephalus microplus]|uniref:cullin-3 n=1 Tax=Rhipicephalus microplus TaxID=6941 RepID=UPI003F6B24C0